MAIAKKKQDPAAKLDWGFDWTPFLDTGESITASTWTLYDDDWNPVSDVALSGPIMTSPKTSTFIGPATDVVAIRGQGRFLTNHITTNQGRQQDQSYHFQFEEQ